MEGARGYFRSCERGGQRGSGVFSILREEARGYLVSAERGARQRGSAFSILSMLRTMDHSKSRAQICQHGFCQPGFRGPDRSSDWPGAGPVAAGRGLFVCTFKNTQLIVFKANVFLCVEYTYAISRNTSRFENGFVAAGWAPGPVAAGWARQRREL